MIRAADFSRDLAQVRALIEEYVAWLDCDLSFQDFDHEMRNLDTVYGAPNGAFLVAESDGLVAGCVGLKRFAPGTAEMKRLYVGPAFRGQDAGRALIAAIIELAREQGYQRILLDAAPKTEAAQRLYQAAGFTEIAPYYDSPLAGTRYFELYLSAKDAR